MGLSLASFLLVQEIKEDANRMINIIFIIFDILLLSKKYPR